MDSDSGLKTPKVCVGAFFVDDRVTMIPIKPHSGLAMGIHGNLVFRLHEHSSDDVNSVWTFIFF